MSLPLRDILPDAANVIVDATRHHHIMVFSSVVRKDVM